MFVAKLEEEGEEALVNGFRVEKLGKLPQILCTHMLHSPLVLRLSNAILVLNVPKELPSVLWGHFR